MAASGSKTVAILLVLFIASILFISSEVMAARETETTSNTIDGSESSKVDDDDAHFYEEKRIANICRKFPRLCRGPKKSPKPTNVCKLFKCPCKVRNNVCQQCCSKSA